MRTVTILLNQRCPFKCRHCSQGFSDSFHGEKESLSPGILSRIIRETDASRYTTVLLAGGEPSLNPELAALGIKECEKAGLSSAMISAPVWAKTAKSAGAFLDKVTGLNLLLLSYDQFHLDFLSFEHYRNAAESAFERKLPVGITSMYVSEADRKRQVKSLAPISGLLLSVTALPVISVGNAAALPAAGKAIRIESEKDLERLPSTCSAGKVVHVAPDLRLYGCCWSVYAGKSPLDLPPRAGETLNARFKRLERVAPLKGLLRAGFLNSLSARGRKALAAAMKGREFRTECDICIAMMRAGNTKLWREVRHTGRPAGSGSSEPPK